MVPWFLLLLLTQGLSKTSDSTYLSHPCGLLRDCMLAWMWMVSLIPCSLKFCSCLITCTLPQSITWFEVATCSGSVDLKSVAMDSFLIPYVGPPRSDIRCLSSVVFELDIQGSSSLSYVALWAVHAVYLVNGIHRLAGILLVLHPEQVLADSIGRFVGTGYVCNAF